MFDAFDACDAAEAAAEGVAVVEREDFFIARVRTIIDEFEFVEFVGLRVRLVGVLFL